MIRIAQLLALLGSLVWLSTGAAGQSIRVDGIRILDFGIYAATEEGVGSQGGTAAGRLNILRDLRLVAQTETIPARVGIRFGFSYVVAGRPRGELVRLTWVTRFPPQGLVNARGETFFKNEFQREAWIGETKSRIYTIAEPWEAVPGEWALELYYQGRLLASKRFTVVAP